MGMGMGGGGGGRSTWGAGIGGGRRGGRVGVMKVRRISIGKVEK